MKTAIILTGAMRSFDKCLPNLQWHVFRHFPGAKFYCVTADDEDSWMAKSLIPGVPHIRAVTQPEMIIPPGCPNEWTPGKPYMHEPYHISVDPRHVLGQLWMLREGWRLYQEANESADLIIRCRPDLWFHSFEVPKFVRMRTNPKSYVDGNGTLAFTPRWGRFGGCNDRFALLEAVAAEAYFTAYDNIPEMISEGAPLHPETLVRYAMERKKCVVYDDMKADFSTLRKTGEMRPPEITGSDLLDAAMR
jgi:hypothetical protein